MTNTFDRLAQVYDVLAGFVFGKVWERIQRAPVAFLKGKREVLIVGGGTGKLLPHLEEGQQVTFVELSPGMILKAKQRATKAAVTFVHADYLMWETSSVYDVILFPFFLDVFREANLRKVITKAQKQLSVSGELHVIDFQKGSWFQRSLIQIMYGFFRLTANLEADRLLDFHSELLQSGFSVQHEKTFVRDWIFYRVYGLWK